jgi:leucyl/phenylalanyl-tRNA---protein transferase
MSEKITPEILLYAYSIGVFPMAESREADDLHWIDPPLRGIFPLDSFHISKRFSRRIAQWDCDVRINSAFRATMEGCADRPETWINAEIFDLYEALHRSGHAHSLEIWEEEQLIGGVYGVTLGGAFFGESMFSRKPEASKLALAYLVHRLRAGGFALFDTQFLTPHLHSLGAIEIPRAAFQAQLKSALRRPARFDPPGYLPDRHSVRQRRIQTS